MERKRIWVEGEGWTVDGQEGIQCEDLQKMLYKLDKNDFIKVDTDNKDNLTYITTGHWEIESDEEYRQRLVNQQTKERNKSNLVVITTIEYDELKEKAGRYDNLCK